MPRKQKAPPKPFYPLVHEFRDSQDEAMQAAGALYNTVTTLRKFLDGKIPEKVLEMLDEATARYERALYGEAHTEGQS